MVFVGLSLQPDHAISPWPVVQASRRVFMDKDYV
jgi:hypothetical protein